MVRIFFLSFVFKGESFSFVKSLWLLNLNNRKIFLWIFYGSALHLMFFGGDWKVFCFLAFEILCEIYVFFRDHCLVYRRAFSAGAFLQGDLKSLRLSVLYQGVFISFIVIYDYILLLFCRSSFFFRGTANLILLTFACVG